mmetsp:Transcript_54131/g.128892  ORF Transcript_54131/g.128892 Transcript_54131/m.128892 type:complete len:222 (-) Transcript_54131:115-780(-)|eukprot:CAMPEP_0178412972 /NCGR_PEP_ID=MMETSP0689_2-20121128/22290_1 /TAXON_ID=160604 /ORGANISM="Amphidinium massartii, Strain CS-259" /LENGTH=221 /DNA_ID=CAMNT_0020034235 /DNA_START=88 /DNA_END=756 /DNA_ORIENTATION=-
MATQAPIEHRWGPYVDNGGTAIAIAGDSYAVMVADTRLSVGYSIHTRQSSKVCKLTDKCVIASCGMKADATTLHRHLKARIVMYEHKHRRQPSIEAVAQMLSTVLYSKRFFPYYTFNVLAGVDANGVGAVYHYDAIGSFERNPYTTSGSGSALVMSVLDCKIAKMHQTKGVEALSKAEITELAKDALASTGERDIFTGDSAEIFMIDATGISTETFELNKD